MRSSDAVPPELDDELPDAERLEAALHDVAVILRRVVGVEEADGTRLQVDPVPLVDSHDGVAFTPWMAACNALECAALGLAAMDLDTPAMVSVEEGLEYMTGGGRPT